MNKQPRMIDKDRLLEWLELKATETGSWVEQVLLRNLVSEEIKKGAFDPDPIPLPTIKQGDKARVAFEQIKERIDEAVIERDEMAWRYALNDINNIVLGWEDELE